MATYQSAYTGAQIDTAIQKINNLESTIASAIAEAKLAMYPVGSVYISLNNVNPSTFIGGTWEQIQEKFLLASSTTYPSGTTGGEATHTLTKDEMPSHFHNFYRQQWWSTDVARSAGGNVYSWKSGTGGTSQKMYNTGTTEQYLLDAQGGNQPHNNMPPYLSVYMWKRIS